MEEVYSKIGLKFLPDIKIRYGQEKLINNLWKEIIVINDEEKRHALIDDLLVLMEQNVENNGFFGRTNKVDCGRGNGFLLNDRELYYQFFENLKCLSMQNVEGKITEGSIINQAIKATILQYAGGDGGNRQLRYEKTMLLGENADVQSIAAQKGKNCFLCTERAAISHNLWLLTGATSYFCLTNSENFGIENPEYKNDTHNFTIVEYGGKFRLYDLAMNNFCLLKSDCIDDLLSGKGLKVEEGKFVKNPGVYANDDSKVKESEM